MLEISMLMISFNKHMNQELDSFIEKIKNHQHFALSRFGDGEIHVIKNNKFHCSQWQFDGEKTFRKALTDCLNYQHESVFYGIPCGCIEKTHQFRDYLFNEFSLDYKNLTFATIFNHSMYLKTLTEFIPHFKKYTIILVASEQANPQILTRNGHLIEQFFPLQKNAWKNHQELVEKMLNYAEKTQPKNKLFLFSAGPLSNVAISQLHQKHPENTYIDIGKHKIFTHWNYCPCY